MGNSTRKLTSPEIRRRREHLHGLQGGKCFWCTRDIGIEATTLDELVPRSRGGTQRWENIVMSCEPCNCRRGDTHAPAWAFTKVLVREAARNKYPPAADRQKAEGAAA